MEMRQSDPTPMGSHQHCRVIVWRLGEGALSHSRVNSGFTHSLSSIYEASRRGINEFLKEALFHRTTDGLHLKRMLEWEDSMGRTPLLIAVENNHLKTVELLLEAGVNLEHISRHRNGGKTALHLAFELQAPGSMVRLLLAHGADPFLENHAGYTPWDVCRENKCKQCEELAKEAIFQGQFRVRDGNFLTSSKSQSLHFKLFACHKLSQNGRSDKQLSALRMVLYKRRISKVVYDIDLMECDARVAYQTKSSHLIHLICPVHFIEEWNGGNALESMDGTFSELYLQGDKTCSENFMEIVKQCQNYYDNLTNEADRFAQQIQTTQFNHPPSNTSFHETNEDQSPEQDAERRISTQSLGVVSKGLKCNSARSSNDSDLFQSTLDSEESLGEDSIRVPSSTESHCSDSRCVVCLDAPRTVGFVHGNSMHVCVCEDCASHFSRIVDRCPICRQTIHHVVNHVYWS
eukprot:g5672.t1